MHGSIVVLYFSPLSVNYAQVFQKRGHTRVALIKILIVLLCYIALGVSYLSDFTITSWNFPTFLDELLKYFICESAGTGEACDRSGFMQYDNLVSQTISYVFLGLLPVVNLVYVFEFRRMREAFRGHKEKSTSRENK